MKSGVLLLVLAFLVGCGDDDDDTADFDAAVRQPDAAIPDAAGPDADLSMPATLEETGLYSDFANEIVAAGVEEYTPQFLLWSDGATKRRWLYLPPGSKIDTGDMDFWMFPKGTKIWKEFTRGGTRVETRLLMKNGDASTDWFMMAYAWNADQTQAVAVPFGAQDVLETSHDIPEPSDCEKCHDRMPDIGLGVSAIQLSHDGDGLTLSDLIANDRLTDPPAGNFTIPGDAVASAALGYLHANCGNCHNDNADIPKIAMRLWLTVDDLGTVEETPVYQTAVGVAPARVIVDVTSIIEPGDVDASAVHVRMNDRGPIGMPPLASEDVDSAGVATVDAWINAL